MKFGNRQLAKCFLFALALSTIANANFIKNSFSQNTQDLLYGENGKDWANTCNNGLFQSPVNIIHNVNTENDTSMVIYDYKIPPQGENKQFLFDGERMYMDIPLGNMLFLNSLGSKELYNAYRIELHFPSEHYITIAGQTPRYALELQIFHNFVSSDKPEFTNQVLKVKKAVVSVLFTIGDNPFGDEFLTQMGISQYNVNPRNKFYILAKKNGRLSQLVPITAVFDTGFNVKALQGLLNILNANQHMYFYYGSETVPPCREEVLWMVYARPRSISEAQFNFLKHQLSKHKEKKGVEEAQSREELFGNKRHIQKRKNKVQFPSDQTS